MTTMFNNPITSDLIVVVEEKPIFCHKIILFSRSEYFRSFFTRFFFLVFRTLFSSMFSEASSTVVRFASEEETLSHPFLSIYHFLHFLYTDSVPRLETLFQSKDQCNDSKNKVRSLRDLATSVIYEAIHMFEMSDDTASSFVVGCLADSSNFLEREKYLYDELDPNTTIEIAFDLIQLGERYFMPKLKGSCSHIHKI